jgi:hypothetical protein
MFRVIAKTRGVMTGNAGSFASTLGAWGALAAGASPAVARVAGAAAAGTSAGAAYGAAAIVGGTGGWPAL